MTKTLSTELLLGALYQGFLSFQMARFLGGTSRDQLRIRQVLTNLVSNALKYGRKRPVDIEISTSRDGHEAFVKITDQGIGISEEEQGKIFDRFERAKIGTRKISGLGLGLYIVRQIVEGHDGEITVESTPDVGTTFQVCLPTGIFVKQRAQLYQHSNEIEQEARQLH